MHTFSELAHRFFVRVTGPDELTFWLWLAGALIVTDVLTRVWHRSSSETFWSCAAPWRIYTHASAVLDYKLLVTDRLITASIVGTMLVSATALGHWGASALTSSLGPGPGWQPTLAGLILFACVRLLMFDIGHYISHYLQHMVPFFWEFHKVHHAAEVMTPVTAYRIHPLEPIMDSVFQGPLQAIGLAGFYYLYGSDQSAMTFVGMNAIVLPFFFIGGFRHSHVWISFGPAVEHVLCSPAQHQIHHSRAPQHLNKNLSEYFSFIDWICGTLYVPKGEEALEFGLHHGPDAELKTLSHAYWVPVRRAMRGLVRSDPGLASLGSDAKDSV